MNIDLHIVDFLLHRLTIYRKRRTLKPERFKAWKAQYDFDNYLGDSEKSVFQFANGVRMVLYKDNKLSYEIFHGFELDEIDFVNRFLQQGDTFIDIGTNVGLFSLHASAIVGESGKVISFEPSSATIRRLEENIALNRCTNIEVVPKGLSSSVGTLELVVAGNGYDAFNSFATPSMGDITDREKVEVTTLDTFAALRKIAPKDVKLMKIDVEGWELHVLKGGEVFFNHDDAPVLLVEFTETNAKNAGTSCIELGRSLQELGYTLYTYDARLKQLKPEPFGKTYAYQNLVASKNNREGLADLIR
jgi:FkbM family methyltransferase